MVVLGVPRATKAVALCATALVADAVTVGSMSSLDLDSVSSVGSAVSSATLKHRKQRDSHSREKREGPAMVLAYNRSAANHSEATRAALNASEQEHIDSHHKHKLRKLIHWATHRAKDLKHKVTATVAALKQESGWDSPPKPSMSWAAPGTFAPAALAALNGSGTRTGGDAEGAGIHKLIKFARDSGMVSVAKDITSDIKAEVSEKVHEFKEHQRVDKKKESPGRSLAYINVPSTFGQTIERAGLSGEREGTAPGAILPSFIAKKHRDKWAAIVAATGPNGQIWGSMFPELRELSNITGCNLVHTPQKYWPSDLAEKYFKSKRSFGMLRDPYDRLVAQFRSEASGGGRSVLEPKRKEISQREGSVERESEQYKKIYEACDVNSWAHLELAKVQAGDRWRGNCHFVPQAEFYEHSHGITLPVDNRRLPDSFNEVMGRHGYKVRIQPDEIRRGITCNQVSAFTLDAKTMGLVKELYAADFDLLCRHFGYCDRDERTCMQQFPLMCGGSPYETTKL